MTSQKIQPLTISQIVFTSSICINSIYNIITYYLTLLALNRGFHDYNFFITSFIV